MSETWKGKTRGGIFGYMFFIYMIRCLGITAAYGFLALVVLYFIPFAPKATGNTWSYARNRLKYGRLKSVALLLKNYYRLGQILIDKVAIGNGMTGKYHFKFENYQAFLDVLNGNTGVIMIGAHVGNWEIGAPFFDEYGKKINIVMFDAEHERIKEILEKNASTRDYKIIPVNEDSLTHVFRITEALDSKLKVPVVFYFAMREAQRTYRFHFFIAETVVRTKEKRAEQALLEQYTQTLEKIVRQYPEQWFNYYPFWT